MDFRPLNQEQQRTKYVADSDSGVIQVIENIAPATFNHADRIKDDTNSFLYMILPYMMEGGATGIAKAIKKAADKTGSLYLPLASQYKTTKANTTKGGTYLSLSAIGSYYKCVIPSSYQIYLTNAMDLAICWLKGVNVSNFILKIVTHYWRYLPHNLYGVSRLYGSYLYMKDLLTTDIKRITYAKKGAQGLVGFNKGFSFAVGDNASNLYFCAHLGMLWFNSFPQGKSFTYYGNQYLAKSDLFCYVTQGAFTSNFLNLQKLFTGSFEATDSYGSIMFNPANNLGFIPYDTFNNSVRVSKVIDSTTTWLSLLLHTLAGYEMKPSKRQNVITPRNRYLAFQYAILVNVCLNYLPTTMGFDMFGVTSYRLRGSSAGHGDFFPRVNAPTTLNSAIYFLMTEESVLKIYDDLYDFYIGDGASVELIDFERFDDKL